MKTSYKLIIFIIISILAIIVLPFMGEKFLTFQGVFANEIDNYVFFSYRVPRVLLAFVAGAGLATAGMSFQSVFSNVLATPYTLGTASAAAFGAVLSIAFGINISWGFFDSVTLFSAGFAFLSLILLYGGVLAMKKRDVATTLLLGVAINFIFSGAVLFLQFNLDYLNTFRILHWMIGSIRLVSYDNLIILFSVLVISSGFKLSMLRELDLLVLGDSYARSKGVNVDYVRWLLLTIDALLVGVIVSFFGPIGFVGLIIPNMMRFIFGAKHQILFVTSFIGGGLLLSGSDVIARMIFVPAVMPVGIVTSVLGACFFVFVLLKRSV